MTWSGETTEPKRARKAWRRPPQSVAGPEGHIRRVPASRPPPERPGGDLGDEELLRRHVDGDRDAFGYLFARHRDRLWAVAVRTLRDSDEAADAVQDAMISAFRRADSFRGDSAVGTWLYRIVVNACLDRMRRRAARPERTSGDERMLDAITTSGTGPDVATGTETSVEVLAALHRLPRDQQMALVLVDMLGYPVNEAAAILDVAPGTVKSRCARGRARLLPLLAHLRPGAVPEQPGSASGSRNVGDPTGHGRPERNRMPAESVLPGQDGGEEPL